MQHGKNKSKGDFGELCQCYRLLFCKTNNYNWHFMTSWLNEGCHLKKKFVFSVFKLQLPLLMWPRNTPRPCDKSMDSTRSRSTLNTEHSGNRSAGELARLFFFYFLLFFYAENLQGHDSTGALSPLPGKEGENSDKMWQADSCSLWLLWKARQALFVWWELLWRKTDGAGR